MLFYSRQMKENQWLNGMPADVVADSGTVIICADEVGSKKVVSIVSK